MDCLKFFELGETIISVIIEFPGIRGFGLEGIEF